MRIVVQYDGYVGRESLALKLDAVGKRPYTRREWDRDGSYTLDYFRKGHPALRVIRYARGEANAQIAGARNLSTGTNDLKMRTNRYASCGATLLGSRCG